MDLLRSIRSTVVHMMKMSSYSPRGNPMSPPPDQYTSAMTAALGQILLSTLVSSVVSLQRTVWPPKTRWRWLALTPLYGSKLTRGCVRSATLT
jgi:hypothetical protein